MIGSPFDDDWEPFWQSEQLNRLNIFNIYQDFETNLIHLIMIEPQVQLKVINPILMKNKNLV